jgi:hypothetical protein
MTFIVEHHHQLTEAIYTITAIIAVVVWWLTRGRE